MKRICHLTSVHPVFDTRIFFKQCRSLAKEGYEVRLIAAHNKDEIVEGVHIIPFYHFKNRIKRILFSPFRMFLTAKRQKADIYHFHDPELLITGFLLRLFSKAKIIYDIHEDYAKNYLDREWLKFNIVRRFTSRTFFYIEKLIARLMAANVVVLPQWKEKYPRAVLVRNYPVLENVPPEKDHNLFVYVGTLGSRRSDLEMTLIFLELLKQYPNLRFKIIGKFLEKKNEAEVLGYIEKNPNIEFLGYQPFSEVKGILSSARYGFVLYSDINYQENIPVKMFEYLAYKVIPIFSSFEDFKYEMEKEGWGIGVHPKKIKEAAQKISDIMVNEEKIKDLENKMSHYRQQYSWDSEKKELINLYKRLIGK